MQNAPGLWTDKILCLELNTHGLTRKKFKTHKSKALVPKQHGDQRGAREIVPIYGEVMMDICAFN